MANGKSYCFRHENSSYLPHKIEDINVSTNALRFRDKGRGFLRIINNKLSLKQIGILRTLNDVSELEIEDILPISMILSQIAIIPEEYRNQITAYEFVQGSELNFESKQKNKRVVSFQFILYAEADEIEDRSDFVVVQVTNNPFTSFSVIPLHSQQGQEKFGDIVLLAKSYEWKLGSQVFQIGKTANVEFEPKYFIVGIYNITHTEDLEEMIKAVREDLEEMISFGISF